MSFEGYTLPPPSGGLDVVSPIDNMDPSTALELVNVFPGAGSPTVRLGYEKFTTTGAGKPVRFIHELRKTDGTVLLIAADDNDIYSIDTAGVVTNKSKVNGYTSGAWAREVFANNIYLTNGVNNAQVLQSTGGLAQDISCSGVTIANLVNVNQYRQRLYFVEKDTCKVWYHATAGTTFVGGSPVMNSYDFQYNFKRGGYLLFTATYTNQTAATSQDLFIACSSEGELIFYTGTDPSDTTTPWQPVAHYIIGRPLGRKSYIRVNQDLWIITQQGIVPISALFQSDPEQALNVVSYRINPLITQYATQVDLSEMWQGFFHPLGRRVYITLPDSTTTATFLVYSIDTKAWTQFALYSSEHCISSCQFDNLPYYGSTTGIIYKGETGYADAVDTSGNAQAILYNIRTAFNFYNARGIYKAFKDCRPIIKAKAGLTLNLGLDTDFRRQSILSSVTTPASTFTAWGVQWGVGAGTINPYTLLPLPTYYQPWSSDVDYIYNRYAIAGQGHCAALRVGGSIKNTPCQFFGFEIRFVAGGQV